MLEFIRSDLAQLSAYNSQHTDNSEDLSASDLRVDRVDVNESPYDLPDELKQKLSWTYQQAIENNRYPDGGYEGLKSAIADYVNESASDFTAVNISIGNGSDELIRSLLIATCIGGAGSILVADPTFSMYRILAQTLGVPVVTIGRSLTNFEMDLAEAQAAIAASGSSRFCCSPQLTYRKCANWCRASLAARSFSKYFGCGR